MNGLKKKYDYARYKESLKTTKIQKPMRKVRVDYKALIAYAEEKGVDPYDLTDEEQEQFVIPS
ncbi:MAG: hypothetical protein J6S79_00720 [Lachnospiraceae bacterium]|nr:hypothetical protein [Lachnospiraceae bacterium]